MGERRTPKWQIHPIGVLGVAGSGLAALEFALRMRAFRIECHCTGGVARRALRAQV